MCAIAQAGLNLTCTFADKPHTYDFTADSDNLGGQLNLYEHYTVAYPATDAVDMHLTADQDPIIRVTKYVTNENGHDWTGYTLTLNGPAGVSFVDPASDLSGHFSTAVVTGNLITFSGGVVPVNHEVELNFRIFVPSGGSFSWCVTQQAIPEPATLALLGMGALALIRRK